jgi:fucose permease
MNENQRFIFSIVVMILMTVGLLFNKLDLNAYMIFITGLFNGVLFPTSSVIEGLKK